MRKFSIDFFLLAILLSHFSANSLELNDNTIGEIIKSLKETFQNSLYSGLKSESDLNNLQLDLLRKRNARCLFQTQGLIDKAEITFDEVEADFYKNLTATSDIVSSLNHKVKIS